MIEPFGRTSIEGSPVREQGSKNERWDQRRSQRYERRSN